MTSFPNDDLDPAQCGGDLILQLSAGNADTVLHALRDIAKHTRGGMQANWRIDGFTSPAAADRHRAAEPARVHGRHREPAVTSPAQMDSLVWVEPARPASPPGRPAAATSWSG